MSAKSILEAMGWLKWLAILYGVLTFPYALDQIHAGEFFSLRSVVIASVVMGVYFLLKHVLEKRVKAQDG
ncbi:MAG: hypothetical protein VX730_06045 [Pseudomonadota bacterium]|nr:hypothetical protein [Pseudomonadota bacterium]